MSERDIKVDIVEVGRRLYARGLIGGNEGNISVRDGSVIYVTPAAVCKGFLVPECIVKTDLEGRPLDRFGAAIAYMHISGAARRLDQDAQVFTGLPTPARSAETLIEVIYEAHVKPGWLLQPFFQYVFRPSGGVPDPTDPSGLARIGDAAIFGLTTTIKY